jgi:hypothetical protein
MPLFAKILAFLNILAAAGFIYLASLDYAVRQTWAYEVFRHELVVDGLPVDKQDSGRRVHDPLYYDLDTGALDLFENAGAGEPVRTQEEEVKRVQKQVKDEIEALEGDARRQKVKELALAQARNGDERDKVFKDFANKNNSTDQLKDDFLALFDKAAAEEEGAQKQDVAGKRRAIAHLLYNLSPDTEKHQRLAIVIGLRSFADEAERQSAQLRQMAQRTRLLSIDDRTAFEGAYLRHRDRIVQLAHEVLRKQDDLKNKEEQSKRTEAEIKKREGEIDKLNEVVTIALAKTQEALERQAAIEKELFGLHDELGTMNDANQKLEREIRILELGRSRGGRQ